MENLKVLNNDFEFKVGDIVKCRVVGYGFKIGITPPQKYGVFCRLEDTDFTGLIHVTQIADRYVRSEEIDEILKLDREVKVKILSVEDDVRVPGKKRIALSYREANKETGQPSLEAIETRGAKQGREKLDKQEEKNKKTEQMVEEWLSETLKTSPEGTEDQEEKEVADKNNEEKAKGEEESSEKEESAVEEESVKEAVDKEEKKEKKNSLKEKASKKKSKE